MPLYNILAYESQNLSKCLYIPTSKPNKLPLVSPVIGTLTHLNLTAKQPLAGGVVSGVLIWERMKEVGERRLRRGEIKGNFLEQKS